MKNGWIVVVHDRHCDDSYHVCEDRDDAIAIAEKAANAWLAHYATQEAHLDRKCYGRTIWSVALEDVGHVYVQPQRIYAVGERGQ